AGQNNGPWATAASNWVYGSVAGADAHKGSDPGDQNLITPIETWNVNASNDYLADVWQARYDGVQRANETLRLMALATDMSAEDITQVTAESRFLRGHYMFELKKLFGNVPWIDETISYTEGNFLVPNTVDVFPNIEADFQYAYDNLPEDYTSGAFSGQYGRANRWAAASYLAKTFLYEKKYTEAQALLVTIIASGKTSSGVKYGLTSHFADNFNPAKKNSQESVFAAQMSVNDGSGAGNANAGDVLNFPYGTGPGGCCGFFQPSFGLANSFKVDAAGLPFLDGSFSNTDLKSDQGASSNDPYTPDNTTAVDPRLDWTVGRRGIPFLDFGPMPGSDWIRNQASAGPYVAMKNLYYKSQAGVLTDNSSWTPGYTANNVNLIRFADVILWAAEVEIEAGSLDQAQTYVNMIRARAADPTGFVQASPAVYKIGLYPAGAFVAGGQDFARRALYFERRLELALEGHRFFDLARWGTAAAELNAYAQHEANVSGYLLIKGATFTAGKNEVLPIPQAEIDKSVTAGASVLTQNPGY
ncbi:MAG: RagB/SusD protein, partial [Chitinophagaceae bacterium]|nr:RagB/SusD protein [Chitinophagaceae bacterium]